MTSSKKKLNELLIKSNYCRKPIKEEKEHSSEYRFSQKKVLNSLCLFNPEVDVLYKNDEILQKDYQMICPFTNHPSVMINASGKEVKKLFPSKWGGQLKLKSLDLNKYNRVKCYIYAKAQGYQNFYFNITIGDTLVGEKAHDAVHAPSLYPNTWNEVVWELGKISRSRVEKMSIVPYVGGFPPEACPDVTFYISDVFVEEVDADEDETWHLNDRISYSHVGYYCDAQKHALVQGLDEMVFHLKNESDEIVYTANAQKIESSLGTFYDLDFSEFNQPGDYYLQTSKHRSNFFVIDDMPYLSSVYKSLNFLRELRCGEDVANVHSACHLNSCTHHSDGRIVPNFGGWHDAGDLSQFEICTAEIAEALLDYACAVKESDKMLYERLLEEAKIGVSFLLRTTFGDGYRALAILYGVYHQNVVTPDDISRKTGVAENGPFENLLSASCLAKAAMVFKDVEEDYANWCLKVAINDFEFGVKGYEEKRYTKRWGTNIDSQVCGVLAACATTLYNLTQDEKYKAEAKKAGRIIMQCQQQAMPKWETPIRGFFYEDPSHQYVLTYEHRGHEQNPVQGLVALCESFKDDVDYQKWEEALKLYREYIYATIDYTKPYNLIPGHIYIIGKLNKERFTIPSTHGTVDEGMVKLEEQVKAGIKLSDDAYLRIFPVAIQRRGYHATLLSKTKAVSLISKVLDDKRLKQLAINQLEWILGKNPFSSSTMYGEGYNYHPLYVAYSKQFIGALPVGFKTYENNDIPYWPIINNAVFKEVWGHTTGKYLWVLADLVK